MKDLTKIKTPFGLLKPKVQKRLRADGGPYQRFHSDGWCEFINTAYWARDWIVRVKPADPIAVLSEMQTEVFKKVLTCDALIKRAMKSETASTVTATFAAVKEWQEAKRAFQSEPKIDTQVAWHKAADALAAIKVPS